MALLIQTLYEYNQSEPIRVSRKLSESARVGSFDKHLGPIERRGLLCTLTSVLAAAVPQGSNVPDHANGVPVVTVNNPSLRP